MAKKRVLRPILATLPKFGTPIFLFFKKKKMRLRHSLDIVVIYRHVQYQKKLMIQS